MTAPVAKDPTMAMLDLDLMPRTRRRPALSRFLIKLQRWRARRAERRLVVRSLAMLSTLDDALLKDIGFRREGSIPSGARSGGRISRVRTG